MGLLSNGAEGGAAFKWCRILRSDFEGFLRKFLYLGKVCCCSFLNFIIGFFVQEDRNVRKRKMGMSQENQAQRNLDLLYFSKFYSWLNTYFEQEVL